MRGKITVEERRDVDRTEENGKESSWRNHEVRRQQRKR